MKKHFVVFTKPGCVHCVNAKQFISLHGDTYDEIIIGTDITREQFMEKHEGVRTLPYILFKDPLADDYFNEETVGGFDALKVFYRDRADDKGLFKVLPD